MNASATGHTSRSCAGSRSTGSRTGAGSSPRRKPAFPRFHLWLLALLLLLPGMERARAQSLSTQPPQASRLGITFISSADHPASDQRYRQALLLGAGWNRWPMYWQWIETGPGHFDWSAYDRLVSNDRAYNLRINAILLGIPDFYRDSAIMRGLYAPVFSDGSDTPGAGKRINDDNPWARFVFQAVARYGPAIDVWEVWNEPDLTQFWTGTPADYARLLKVAYLAAHQANPNAEIMFGGLAYLNPETNDWLADTLAIIARDPQRAAYNWYLDKVAVHNYSNSWRSGWVVQRVKRTLATYGLERPVWLNESGLPVWDDYPGPTWAANAPDQRRWRGTIDQQAAFVIQSTAYAWASGAEVVFYHQLYDDCGNQAAGTDFSPDTSELAGDAHGLYRNERNAVCFSQSPMPGTPRPAATAFHVLARVFGRAPFQNGAVLDLDERGVVIAFDRPSTAERIYVLWNNSAERITLELPASGPQAELFSIANQDYLVEPRDNVYRIALPPASVEPGGLAVGGAPYILVERLPDGLTPINPALVQLEPFDPDYGPWASSRGVDAGGLPPSERLFPTPGPLIGGQPEPVATAQPPTAPALRPTTDPENDVTAPTPFMNPLPVISPPTFRVSWGARDDSGIAAYVVWVRPRGGDWLPWLTETTDTSADFTGEAGTTYEFAVWARDLAGNWSLNTDLTPMATTAVQPAQ